MVCIIRLLSAKSLFPGGNLALENVIFNDGNFFLVHVSEASCTW